MIHNRWLTLTKPRPPVYRIGGGGETSDGLIDDEWFSLSLERRQITGRKQGQDIAFSLVRRWPCGDWSSVASCICPPASIISNPCSLRQSSRSCGTGTSGR